MLRFILVLIFFTGCTSLDLKNETPPKAEQKIDTTEVENISNFKNISIKKMHPDTSFILPPSGEFFAGYIDQHIINTSMCPSPFYNENTKDYFSQKNPNHCNEVLLRIYYPTLEKKTSSYYPLHMIINDIKDFTENENIEFSFQLKEIKSHSSQYAEIAPGKFPVIFFSPGYGLPAQEYENIIIHLVSNGYIVVGLNSEFISGNLHIPYGRIANVIVRDSDEQKKDLFNNTISDLTFSVSYLKNKNTSEEILNSIDWDKLALVGHSLGASAIAHFAQKTNLKVKAIATLDLAIDLLCHNNCPNIINIPFMHMFASQSYNLNKDKCFPFYCPKENQQTSPDKYLYVVRNKENDDSYSMHMSFCDYSTLQYHPAIAPAIQSMLSKNPANQFLGIGNGFAISQTINNKLLEFFKKYL